MWSKPGKFVTFARPVICTHEAYAGLRRRMVGLATARRAKRVGLHAKSSFMPEL
jgi:hypothetical protein